ARDDRADVAAVRGGHERRTAAGARAEKPDRQRRRVGIRPEPVDNRSQALREQRNVEAILAAELVELLLAPRQQIDEERREPVLLQDAGDVLIARTVARAAAAV